LDLASFLKTVITTERGYFCLATGKPTDNGHQQWAETWYQWPDEIDNIVSAALRLRNEFNVYFSAHLFETKNSAKKYVLPSRTIQCDLDEALPPVNNQPSVLVMTSPDRYQGYWLLDKPIDNGTLEGISRKLTYSIPYSDHSGWSLGHKMRLPETFNYKYSDGIKNIYIVSTSLGTYVPPEYQPEISDDEWKPEPLGTGVRKLWIEEIRPRLPRSIVSKYDKKQKDRSGALWALMRALFNLGYDRNTVFWIAEASANNKWRDVKYGDGQAALVKDILRAEAASDIEADNDREAIKAFRALPGPAHDKREMIAEYVYKRMTEFGTFISTPDGTDWYIVKSQGQPIIISERSLALKALLDNRFGLNASEPEQRYTVNFLLTQARLKSKRGTLAILSHYSAQENALLLHCGDSEVIYIDHEGFSRLSNGDLGLVFPWRMGETPFEPDMENPLDITSMFEGCFDNLIEISKEQAMALCRSWLVFLLCRNEAIGRPLFALFGQPGSGKTTLFRRIYALLYGPSKSINTITKPEEYDHAVATDPFVVFDNVDTWSNWLPDKLALSAAASDLQKRKLYTDFDTVIIKRQALIGITAHNPQFRREDIVDRLIMLNFHRLPEFAPEAKILGHVLVNRNRLWGAMVNDLVKVIKTPMPADSEVPQFRVNDFARIGLWAARALGYERDFIAAIKANKSEQVNFNLEEENLLIDTIRRWLLRRGDEPTDYYSPSDLWDAWKVSARDYDAFERAYKNPLRLGRKLWALHDTLKNVFAIDYAWSEDTGQRTWKIEAK
jgi:hypothetical protein